MGVRRHARVSRAAIPSTLVTPVRAAPVGTTPGPRGGAEGGLASADGGPAVQGLDVPSALVGLRSSRRGLGEEEATRRRAAVGPNSLPPPPHRSIAAELGAQLTNMFAVVLVAAAGLTFPIYAFTSPPDPANLELAFGILGVVVINAGIGFAQEHSAERTAEALQAMVPRVARVLRDGLLTETGADGLVPGDVVVLESGDAVSADCRLRRGAPCARSRAGRREASSHRARPRCGTRLSGPRARPVRPRPARARPPRPSRGGRPRPPRPLEGARLRSGT